MAPPTPSPFAQQPHRRSLVDVGPNAYPLSERSSWRQSTSQSPSPTHSPTHSQTHSRPRSRRRPQTPQSVSPSSSTESLLLSQQQRQRPRPLKVVVIGPASVGKTTLRQAYFTGRFQRNYRATIGADFEAKVVEHRRRRSGDGGAGGEVQQRVLLTVWDTAGQERFRALGSAFYRGADAAIICFDAAETSAEALRADIQGWYEDFRDKSGLTPAQHDAFCWVAVGCKADTRPPSGAVPRRQVRDILDAILPRPGWVRNTGAATGEGSSAAAGNGSDAAAADALEAAADALEGKGDKPPAAPRDVLSRDGIHKEDDRELTLDSGHGEAEAVTSAADDRLPNGDASLIEEQNSRGATQNGSDDASASSSQDLSTPRLLPAPSPKAGLIAFPASSSPSPSLDALPRTPRPPSHLSNGNFAERGRSRSGAKSKSIPIGADAGGDRETAPDGLLDASLASRQRLDSSVSTTSSAYMSVYHTPRNSTLFNGSAPTSYAASASLATAPSGSFLSPPQTQPDRSGSSSSSSRRGHRHSYRHRHAQRSRDSALLGSDLESESQSQSGASVASTSTVGARNGTGGADTLRPWPIGAAARDGGGGGGGEGSQDGTVSESRTPGAENGNGNGGRPKGEEDDSEATTLAGHPRSPQLLSAQPHPEPLSIASGAGPRPRALSTPSVQSVEDLPSAGAGAGAGAGAEPSAERGSATPALARGFSLFYTSSLEGTSVSALFTHVVSRCARTWACESERDQRAGDRSASGGVAAAKGSGGGSGGESRSRGGKGKARGKRRSIWNLVSVRGRQGAEGDGEDEEEDEEEAEVRRIQEEMRRMVRLSDGKGEGGARGAGGCC